MKKTIILLSAALAFIACNKETPVKESASGISKIVFNVDINRADDTKGVKAGWENGDKVYVFFQGLVGDNKYAVFTYNGTSWDKNANDITAKDIFDAKVDYGDRLTAICVPYGDQPTFSPSGDSFTMTNKVQTFYLSASTTYSTGIVEESTIEIGASLKMKAPDNLIQICVQGTGGKPASGNEFVLTVNNVKPFTVEEIVPGSPVSCTTGTVNFPLPALLTYVNKDPGYYFWGILDNASAGAIDYNFQLVQQNVEKKYAVSSRSKKVSGKELTGSAAIKVLPPSSLQVSRTIAISFPWVTPTVPSGLRVTLTRPTARLSIRLKRESISGMVRRHLTQVLKKTTSVRRILLIPLPTSHIP